MSPVFDCRDEAQLLAGMRQARQAIGRGELVVLPTDTVYGIAADAFSARAVQGLLEAKGRGRQSPPPVLVAGVATLRALVAEVPEAVERLVEAFWPGGLTIVLPAQPSLSWDLGDTHGTVAVRMPANNLALELLEETGPLAVSSANLTGKAAAIMASDARAMLGDRVAVYLDGGPSATGVASTIVDATSLVIGGAPLVRVLREGAIDRAALRDVLGELLEPDPVPTGDAPESDAPVSDAPVSDAPESAVPESDVPKSGAPDNGAPPSAAAPENGDAPESGGTPESSGDAPESGRTPESSGDATESGGTPENGDATESGGTPENGDAPESGGTPESGGDAPESGRTPDTTAGGSPDRSTPGGSS